VAHDLQRRHQAAGSPVRLPSAAPHASALCRERPGHRVGRHARHRLAGGCARGLRRFRSAA
jgi:hypothetical protein